MLYEKYFNLKRQFDEMNFYNASDRIFYAAMVFASMFSNAIIIRFEMLWQC